MISSLEPLVGRTSLCQARDNVITMKTVHLILGMASLAVTATQGACDRNLPEARKESQQEIAEAQREADRKVAEARREAEKQIAEARQEAREKMTEARQDLTEKRRGLQEALKNARQETKHEYLDYAKKRVRLIELREQEAKDAATKTPPADQRAFDSLAREVDDMQRSLQQQLSQLEDNKLNWPAAKAQLNNQLNELEARLEKLARRKAK